MPGSEFRMLPRLPLDFKKYRLVRPSVLGKALTQGWTPVASVNYQDYIEGAGAVLRTKFLIAKEPKEPQAARSSGPLPVLMFPQPEGEGTPDAQTVDPEDHVKHVLDQIASMSQEDVLELHRELQAKRAASVPDVDDEEDDDGDSVDDVSAAMDELLGDGDDGSDDDDDDE